MQGRIAAFLAVVGGWLVWPTPALAGMPSIGLANWAALRLETLSFLVLVLLVSAAVVRWLWNTLAVDLPRLPRLTYRRALAAVVLWGMLLAVVLTMIAGSRELLTPGAWQKQGVLYKLAGPTDANPAIREDPDLLKKRREHLSELQTALWAYAAEHEGKFPAQSDPLLEPSLWEMPHSGGMPYLVVPDKNVNDADDAFELLVYEQEVYGPNRLVLTTSGEIKQMTTAEIHRKLRAEKSP